MVDAIVSFAVETIRNLLIEEGTFLRGVGEQVRLLNDDLGRIQRFLRSADTKQSARESVQPWIKEFRAIAYEASDLIEDYAFRSSSQRKQICTVHTLKRYACGCCSHHKLGKEIQSLRSRISDLTKNFGEFDVAATMMQEEGSSSSMQRQLRRTYSFVADPDFIAVDGDVELLVKYLMNENEDGQHHSVVSVFGMGGLGKTTLARKVYHHPKLRHYFSGFAWICVSQQWQAKDVLLGILSKFVGDDELKRISSRSEDLVAKELSQVLQDRKCLIVLDDIWTREAWDCIKHAIPIAEEGSKILLTTRIESVAVHIGPDGYHHKPRLLNEEESWELLQKKSLRKNRDCEDFSELEKLGQQMVKYCGGLPLAVVVLAGMLSTKKGLNEWISVHENVRSLLEKGEIIGQVEGQIPKLLALSYYELPYQLKPCFVYLGKFKEDSEIEAERLYQLWIAEGMVFQSDRMGQETMMEVAERYLEELANRCMVQVQMHEEYEAAITKFKSCRLHDLMRDVCLIKAKEEGLYKVIEFGEGDDEATATSDDQLERYYRLDIRLSKLDDSKHVHLPRKKEIRHLRSFRYEGLREREGFRYEEFKNFKRLRVLAIVRQQNYINSCCSCLFIPCEFNSMLPGSISKLIHLRYLSLRGSYFFKLPSSMSNLQHLETLDLGATTVRIPNNVLGKMGNLRHLYLPGHYAFIKQWCKLRFDGLSKLETLYGFHNNFCDCKSLSKLTNLRALRADVSDSIEELEEFINSISSNMQHLRACELDICECDFLKNSSEKEGLVVVEQLLSCGYIQKMYILCLLNKLPPPPSSSISPGLRWLTLFNSQIEEDPMGTLEKLPNLRRLDLYDWSYVGKEMICHSTGFPQLRVLVLQELPKLEKWKVDEGAMPKLTSLQIDYCSKLEMIPDGLRSITTLQELTLRDMPEEFNSRVRIVNNNGEEQQGQDFHKISHVLSVVIRKWREE